MGSGEEGSNTDKHTVLHNLSVVGFVSEKECNGASSGGTEGKLLVTGCLACNSILGL